MFFHGHMVMIFGTSKKTSHESESRVGRLIPLQFKQINVIYLAVVQISTPTRFV